MRLPKPFLWAAVLAACCAAARGQDIETKHVEMLYPVVRVTVGSGGGSGTVLYSEDRGDGCQTYVLTNHHVVDDAIKVKTEWSSLLQQDVKREANDPIKVEVFRYTGGSRQDVTDTYRAEILAHEQKHDLALVKLLSDRKIEHVAVLLPEEQAARIFEPIWAVGCSLLHPPVVTEGIIDYLDDIIDRKVYWMGSANIIFGNSGGAVFLERDGHYYFVGVPSRVSVSWGTPITHMGYFVPIPRIREWLTEEHLTFLLDASVKPEDSLKKREELREKAQFRRLMEQAKPDEAMPTSAPAARTMDLQTPLEIAPE